MGITFFNNNTFLIFFPEMSFFFLIICLLQNGLYIYNKINKITTFLYYHFISYIGKLAILILILILIIFYYYPYTHNYLTYFTFNFYTYFFKILICILAIPCIYILMLFLNTKKIYIFEYIILLLISIFSCFLFISASELSILYICLEIMALTNYILMCLPKTNLYIIEAALKYFFLGIASSGIFLFGLVFLYGFTGCSTYDQLIKIFFCINTDTALPNFYTLNISICLLFIFSGFIFKLSGAPFHNWSPDIYDGGPTSIIFYFLIITKLTILIVFIRFLALCNQYLDFLQLFFIIIIISSFIIGSFGAFLQTKIKRFLAYSSIFHTGFLLLGILAQTYFGYISLFFYMIIYCITNILLWLFIIDLRIEKKGKIFEISTFTDLNSIFKINPIISWIFLIIFLSMIGLPPFVGFISKILILFAVYQSKFYFIFFSALCFSIITSFYYLRIIKIIFFENAYKINNIFLQSKIISFFISINILFLVYFFIFPNKIYIFLKIICFSFFL